MKFSRQDIAVVSDRAGFNRDTVEAVLRKEAGRGGFDPKTGKILIQFEPHKFRKHVPQAKKDAFLAINAKVENKEILPGSEKVLFELWVLALSNKIELQAAEWKAFNAAFKIDEEAALLSTSFGAFQILGENYLQAGFNSVVDFHQNQLKSETEQLFTFITFINGNGILRKILKKPELTRDDCALFARFYNGAGYVSKPVAERYDTLLFKHYQDIKAGK